MKEARNFVIHFGLTKLKLYLLNRKGSECHELPHRCSPYVQTTCDNVTSQSSRVGQVLQIEV